MAHVLYGIWDTTLYDNRTTSIFEIEELPRFSGFDAFNQGNPIKAFLGGKGFFVFEPGVSLVDALWQYLDKAASESCGKCTPCRMGTRILRDRLDALRRGELGVEALDEMSTLAEHVQATSLCRLGQTCTVALLAVLRHFREEVENEILQGRIHAQPGMTYVTAPCIEACPAKVNVPRYIDYIRDGKFSYSLGVILQKYPMAATCGRVCVRFCEQACYRGQVDQPVGIKVLKRFVADHEKDMAEHWFSPQIVATPKPGHLRVAVVGAGPAGVSCAYHLLLKGYPVDIFEAKAEAGGMASSGIPSYRLPKDVLQKETGIIEDLGGRFLYNQRLGRDFTLDALFAQGYKAVFLGLGCDMGRLLGVEGEAPGLKGCLPGLDFLLRVHHHLEYGQDIHVGEKVVVVGGGNVAMDCVRSALRLGSKEVRLVYRRTKEDMPADHEEVEAAEKEGVVFHCLANPTRILSQDGKTTGVELARMRQTEPDERGRRGVTAEPGPGFTLDCDMLISAIGQQVDTRTFTPADSVEFNKWGCLSADPTTLATSRRGVFAGGDCVLGPSTLIHAMANGLKAARSIDDYLTYGRVRFFPRSRMRKLISEFKTMAGEWIETPVAHRYRVEVREIDPEERKRKFEEVEKPISTSEAYREAERCLRCYRIYSVITESPIPEGSA